MGIEVSSTSQAVRDFFNTDFSEVEKTLVACPFCGQQPPHLLVRSTATEPGTKCVYPYDIFYWVKCLGCGARGPIHDCNTSAGAVQSWNSRK